ncbi:MAG: DUF4013 domain-containing protein [Halobacteriales archaeon]|nr:DUF4013 domain-containing protein [Halobacteriales archaeon]
MLRAVLWYPLRGPNTERIFLPGLIFAFGTALLLELPSLLALTALVPLTVIVGYLARVYTSAIAGKADPPPFDHLTDIVRQGVVVNAIAIVYLLPAIVVVGITAIGIESIAISPSELAFGMSLRILGGTTAVFLFVSIAVYLVPAAVGIAVPNGTVRRAFRLRSVVTAAIDGAYFTGFWIGAGLIGSTIAVISVLTRFGRLGSVVGIVLLFHVAVATAYIVGRGFGSDGTPYALVGD